MSLTTEDIKELVRPAQPAGHFDPNDELSPEEIAACEARANKHIEETNDKVLNLETSAIRTPGQNYVLLSFVGPGCAQKTEDLGMKVWGAFDTMENAKAHMEVIHKDIDNKHYHIYVMSMYEWAVIPPKVEYMTDQHHHDEKLHEMITEHDRQTSLASELFSARNQKLMSNPDVNQHNRDKAALLEIKEDNEEDEDKNPTDVGGSYHKQIFGEPLPLPKVEIHDQEGATLSTSQGLSETDAQYKTRMLELAPPTTDTFIGEETSHAEKFQDQVPPMSS
jgi:hypothetical protein